LQVNEKKVKQHSVLLVDDDKEYLEVLAEQLLENDYNVLCASDGEEALQIIKQMPIVLVVLDVKMSGMDGILTLEEIKKIYMDIEVIMLTGLADVETAIKAMELGAFDYLLKPLHFEELLHKIQDAIIRKNLMDNLEGLSLLGSG